MQLFILRHGHAEHFARSDAERALSERGKQEVHSVVQRHEVELAKLGQIYVSPYTRAQQTAAVVSDYFPDIPLTTLDLLTPGDRPQAVINFLSQQDENSHLLLVSHQPLVTYLVADLCDVPANSVGMHTAALASITLNPLLQGKGELQYID